MSRACVYGVCGWVRYVCGGMVWMSQMAVCMCACVTRMSEMW